jgi:predicted Zn-dependent protease
MFYQIQKNWFKVFFVMFLTFTLGACTSFLTGPDVNLVRTGENSNVSNKQEQQSKKSEHERIIASFGGVYHNRKVEIMVAQIVGKLLKAAKIPHVKYSITLLDSPEINAFALPGGYVYVSRGVLALANDESELAAVLAHEISHLTLRHARARSSRVATSRIVDQVITSVLGGDINTDQGASRSRLSLAAFSQSQELASDKQGIKIAVKAGYDATAAARLLGSMGRYAAMNSEQDSGDDFLSTHPSTPDRIQKAIQVARAYVARAYSAPQGELIIGREKYLRAVDGLIYGDSGAQGAIIGKKFVHPNLGFTFSVPKRFSLQNSQAALVAVAGKSEALRFDSANVPKTMDLSLYLRSGWVSGLDTDSIITSKEKGFEVASAQAKTDDWVFIVSVVRFKGEVYRFIFAAKKNSAGFKKAAKDVLRSFREVNGRDIAQIQKNKIQIVKATSSDNIASLLKKMGDIKNSKEIFLVLNNLYDGDLLIKGQQYKIVTAE